MLAQNGIPNTIEQQLAALEKLGGLDVLGTAKIENMYHAGWAWAGDTPFHDTKLVASLFRRHPQSARDFMAGRGSSPTKTPRPQFHHVNDIAPTIYEILGMKPPKVVDGVKQDRSMGSAWTILSTTPAPGRKTAQYFENNGSRGIYHDGWIAATSVPSCHGMRQPGRGDQGLGCQYASGSYIDLHNDFSQADDLAAKHRSDSPR